MDREELLDALSIAVLALCCLARLSMRRLKLLTMRRRPSWPV